MNCSFWLFFPLTNMSLNHRRKPTQKGTNQTEGLYPEPLSCEAKGLPTAPLCSLKADTKKTKLETFWALLLQK